MSEQESKMNKDYKSVFNEEFSNKKIELDKLKDEYDKVKNIYIDDLKKIGKTLQPVVDLISRTHDNSARLRSMKDYEELYIKYKDEDILSYSFSYNNSDEDDYKYRVEVYSNEGILPDLFIMYYDEENYYYQEDEKYTHEEGYISYPFVSLDNSIEDNNLENVIEKHVKYIANYIADDKHGLKNTKSIKGGRILRESIW